MTLLMDSLENETSLMATSAYEMYGNHRGRTQVRGRLKPPWRLCDWCQYPVWVLTASTNHCSCQPRGFCPLLEASRRQSLCGAPASAAQWRLTLNDLEKQTQILAPELCGKQKPEFFLFSNCWLAHAASGVLTFWNPFTASYSTAAYLFWPPYRQKGGRSLQPRQTWTGAQIHLPISAITPRLCLSRPEMTSASIFQGLSFSETHLARYKRIHTARKKIKVQEKTKLQW